MLSVQGHTADCESPALPLLGQSICPLIMAELLPRASCCLTCSKCKAGELPKPFGSACCPVIGTGARWLAEARTPKHHAAPTGVEEVLLGALVSSSCTAGSARTTPIPLLVSKPSGWLERP